MHVSVLKCAETGDGFIRFSRRSKAPRFCQWGTSSRR